VQATVTGAFKRALPSHATDPGQSLARMTDEDHE
jgi:hypothetical protein